MLPPQTVHQVSRCDSDIVVLGVCSNNICHRLCIFGGCRLCAVTLAYLNALSGAWNEPVFCFSEDTLHAWSQQGLFFNLVLSWHHNTSWFWLSAPSLCAGWTSSSVSSMKSRGRGTWSCHLCRVSPAAFDELSLVYGAGGSFMMMLLLSWQLYLFISYFLLSIVESSLKTCDPPKLHQICLSMSGL